MKTPGYPCGMRSVVADSHVKHRLKPVERPAKASGTMRASVTIVAIVGSVVIIALVRELMWLAWAMGWN